MKKLLLLAAITVLAAQTTYANEMIVKLKSGNTVVIEYTGAIERVSLEGDSDAILGMTMHTGTRQNPELQRQKSAARPTPEEQKTEEAGDKEKSSLKFSWARPIDDENLKRIQTKK